MGNTARFRKFVQSFTELIERVRGDEETVFVEGKALLAELIVQDDWLPEQFAKPALAGYQQYLLYCDPLERFSVVSFVWGPGQRTPIHDHTVWGMVGVMRGRELCEEFGLDPATGPLLSKGTHEVCAGGIDLVSPGIGDIHRVSNALLDRVSVSVHVYGGNIGALKRNAFDLPTGGRERFISGYSSEVIPNIWDRSAESANDELRG